MVLVPLTNTMVPVYRAGSAVGNRINQVSQGVPKIGLFASFAKADTKKPFPFPLLSVAERTADSPNVKSSRHSCTKGKLLIQHVVSRDLVSISVPIRRQITKFNRFLTRDYSSSVSSVYLAIIGCIAIVIPPMFLFFAGACAHLICVCLL